MPFKKSICEVIELVIWRSLIILQKIDFIIFHFLNFLPIYNMLTQACFVWQIIIWELVFKFYYFHILSVQSISDLWGHLSAPHISSTWWPSITQNWINNHFGGITQNRSGNHFDDVFPFSYHPTLSQVPSQGRQ